MRITKTHIMKKGILLSIFLIQGIGILCGQDLRTARLKQFFLRCQLSCPTDEAKNVSWITTGTYTGSGIIPTATYLYYSTKQVTNQLDPSMGLDIDFGWLPLYYKFKPNNGRIGSNMGVGLVMKSHISNPSKKGFRYIGGGIEAQGPYIQISYTAGYSWSKEEVLLTFAEPYYNYDAWYSELGGFGFTFSGGIRIPLKKNIHLIMEYEMIGFDGWYLREQLTAGITYYFNSTELKRESFERRTDH
jgi:hypothetical protein